MQLATSRNCGPPIPQAPKTEGKPAGSFSSLSHIPRLSLRPGLTPASLPCSTDGPPSCFQRPRTPFLGLFCAHVLWLQTTESNHDQRKQKGSWLVRKAAACRTEGEGRPRGTGRSPDARGSCSVYLKGSGLTVSVKFF